MKKQGILLAAVVLFCAIGLAQAQDSGLHGSLDLTYQSQFIWRGFNIYGNKSAIQPSLDLDLFGTGLGVNVMGHRANSSGYENGERWDYNLYYQNMMNPEEDYAVAYRLGWVYYNFPQLHSQDFDLQELHAVLSLPKMCTAGVIPSYVLVKLWPSSGGSIVNGPASGFAHIFMLDYPLTVGGILPDTPEQVFNLHAEAIYNDGVDPRGIGVDHDWSNAVFGVSTGIDLVENLVLTPGVYHQITMDKSVNDNKTETWATVSLTYNF
ncbi:MAG: TorF family putative porin [Planctomycetota bacterium]